MDGSIAPCRNPEDLGPFDFDAQKVVDLCKKCQNDDYTANEEYRKARNLPPRYEYNHFIIEGRVLYLMDTKGRVLDRTMYKIKPKDIEEVHWSNFDMTIQGRVREAIEKIVLRGKSMTEDSLKEGRWSDSVPKLIELDMGPKEWGRFGTDVMKYATKLKAGEIPSKLTDTRHVIVLGGYPGSGREEFVNKMKEQQWTILSKDTETVKEQLKTLLSSNTNVIIDQANLTVNQRKSWYLYL
jgi:hypothetical protein